MEGLQKIKREEIIVKIKETKVIKEKKNERLFYLDFVRAIAVFLIILTHYNAVFVFGNNPPLYEKCLLFEMPFGIYIGNLGVSLFLIISGAALMYVYENKLYLKEFFIKRFWAIFPMFWLAYLVAVLPKIGVWKNLGFEIPSWRIILTIIGMDGYLSEYGANFYVLGEWFLGFIILFYILFPLFRWLMNKSQILTWIIVFALYLLSVRFYNGNLAISKVIFVRLPELCFGMYFVKNRKSVNWYTALIAMIVLAVNSILKPDIHDSIQTTYIGIAFFLVLVFLANYIHNKKFTKLCGFICKYSYAVFLVHHVIIEYIQNGGTYMASINMGVNYMLFLVTTIIIIIIAVLLYNGSYAIINAFRKQLSEIKGTSNMVE